jgi:pimeloyl-ACP methyl ester carboxylesterase
MPTQKITVEGLQLNVSIRGQGSPLLLLNGLGGLIRTFDPLRDELVGYRTITLDVPGVGKSQMPRRPMRLPRHADLIAEMLKQLGIEQVDVFGVSWGGALAQEFALRYPGMVRRLILAATSAGPAMLVKPADILDFFRSSKRVKPGKQEGSSNSLQTLLRFGVVNGMLTANPRTYYHTLVRLYNAHILRRAIRRAELYVLQGEGHFFVVTSARRTAEAIGEFLSQQHDDEEPALMIANGMYKPRLQPSERN